MTDSNAATTKPEPNHAPSSSTQSTSPPPPPPTATAQDLKPTSTTTTTTTTTTTSTQDPTTTEAITFLGPPKPTTRQKPDFSLLPFQNNGGGGGDTTASDLKKRLSAFLPEIAAANEELEKLGREGGLEGKRLEDVGEGEEYVEMELGLGVLEGRGSDDGDDEEDEEEEEDDDDDEESSGEEEESSGEEDEVQRGKESRDIPVRTRDGDKEQQKEKDVLGRLMGYKNGRRGGGTGGDKAPGIQEVE